MESANTIHCFPLKPISAEPLSIQPYIREQSATDSFSDFVQNNNLTFDTHVIRKAKSTLDKAVEYELKYGRKFGPDMDMKKLRRIMSNRLSAKRARIKKSQYISEMETTVDYLQELISVLTPEIESSKEKQNLLVLENDYLQKLVEIRSNESKRHELEIQKKQDEINKLKELEKFVNNKDKHDSISRPQPKTSLGFPNFGLGLVPHQLSQKQLSGSSFVRSELKITETLSFAQCGDDKVSAYESKKSIEQLTLGKNQDEANIDQYLNFEALNLHPSSS